MALAKDEVVCALLTPRSSSPDHVLKVGRINVVSHQVNGRDVEAGLRCKGDMANFVAKLFYGRLHSLDFTSADL